MKGFIACDSNGQPVPLELSEEITNGDRIFTTPFPVFIDANDAEEAILSHQSRYGDKATFQIRHVELVINEISHVVEYNEDEEDLDEEDDNDD